jgi:hypothetical protein
MSLTLALVILGAVVLAAVLVHGLWQARRVGPKQATPLPEFVEPVLIEPSFGSLPASAEAPLAQPAMTGLSTEASSDEGVPKPATLNGAATSADAIEMPTKPAWPALRRSTQHLDALIDAIVPITLDAPVSGEAALVHMPPTRRAGSKPFLIEGLNAESGEWEAPAPGRRYSELQAGVLMANRHGPINEIEYSEFVQKVQAFADAMGALVEPPDMLEVVARARELDAFAGAHDAQLAVRLIPKGPAWSVGFLMQHAARHGFVPGAMPGRLVLPGAEEGSPPVLTVSFDPQAALADEPAQVPLTQATLSLDVPQTEAAAEPFATWQHTARALATDLDALLLDDAGQPLNLHAFASIGSELDKLYAALSGRELAAGSPAARRLFS